MEPVGYAKGFGVAAGSSQIAVFAGYTNRSPMIVMATGASNPVSGAGSGFLVLMVFP